MLEKIESGKKYLNSSDELVTVLFKDDVGIYYQRLEGYRNIVSTMYALGNWKELPKQKKRYWKWILEASDGAQCEPIWFLDDDLKTTNGEKYHIEKCVVIKKLEDRFIEVDE